VDFLIVIPAKLVLEVCNRGAGIQIIFVIPAKLVLEVCNRGAGIQILFVIPAKAGIQEKKTGFPRIKSGAGLVKPGMTIKKTFYSKYFY
jgi:hypothetical protein